MRPFAVSSTITCYRCSVMCVRVCLCVCWSQSWALQNGWTDRVCIVRDMDLDGPKEPGVTWGPGPSHGNNNNNSHDNVYGAVIMTQSHCESSPGSFDECRLSAGWPPTLRPSQSTWAFSHVRCVDGLKQSCCSCVCLWRECHLCRVAGNSVWSHIACELPSGRSQLQTAKLVPLLTLFLLYFLAA